MAETSSIQQATGFVNAIAKHWLKLAALALVGIVVWFGANKASGGLLNGWLKEHLAPSKSATTTSNGNQSGDNNTGNNSQAAGTVNGSQTQVNTQMANGGKCNNVSAGGNVTQNCQEKSNDKKKP